MDLQPHPVEDLQGAFEQGAENPDVKRLRKEVVALVDELREDEHCPMFRGLWQLFEDYNDVLFILRMDARAGSAKPGFAEAYAFTGPPAAGKSFVVLRLLRLF